MKKNDKIKQESMVTLNGEMTFGQLENGLHTADFMCCEDVQMEAYNAKCKVQVMRDGNVYMTELPKRIRNKAIFRDDNCTLSKGQDGRYYFVFSLDGNFLDEMPGRLMRQANAIARKIIKEQIFK